MSVACERVNVREMLKLRLLHDPVARSSGIDPDGLDDPLVEALPEMTVFKQVQCYLMFRCGGASDLEALESLYEMHKPMLEMQGLTVGPPVSTKPRILDSFHRENHACPWSADFSQPPQCVHFDHRGDLPCV